MDKRRSRTRNNRKKEKQFDWNILLTGSILICIVLLSTFFAILNIGSSSIINNVYINDISVSALSTEDAKQKLNSVIEEDLKHELSISFEDYETTLLPAEINFSYNTSIALEQAYAIGRTGNILTNNFKLFIALFRRTNIEAPISYDSDKLDNIIENMSVEIPDLVLNPTYYISNGELIITKGTKGNILDKEKTKDIIISSIKNKDYNITLPVKSVNPDKIDLEKIHSEIYSEPQNASITKNPYSISAEKKGIDFAISVEEAQKLIDSSEDEEIYIPLKYTDADITIADLGEDIFGNTLSLCTTKYDSTNINRATNLEISTNKINGTILAPGEVFSFNKVVGERTTKNGFKEAIIYADGELDYGIGGGICQISSTLYNAALKANLEIVERKNHSMTVNYLPIGCDATVSYGSVDFKFKNSRSYPVKIDATVNSGIVSISILGVKEKEEYDVDIIVETTQKDDFETVYERLSSIPEGTEIIKQTGKYGYKCSTYRVLYKNGKIISKDLLSTDTYKPQKQIVQIHK